MKPRRNLRRRTTCGVAVTAVAAMGASMLASPVDAAVGASRVVTVSPADSIVLIDGLNQTDTYTVRVVRDGVTVGSATGSPATFGTPGTLELNHAADTVAGTFCWTGVTPEILPDDEVHVTGPGVDDFATVRGVTVTSNPEPDGDAAFTVTGTLGAGLDPSNLNVFVRLDLTPGPPGDDETPEPVDDDAGDWRANSSDEGNTLVLHDDDSWTATFTTGSLGEEPGLVDAAVLAAAGNPRVLEATYSVGAVGLEGVGNENTSAGFGGGDPIPDGCPPREDSAIGWVSPTAINQGNAAAGLTVSGATASPDVTVTLSDGTADPVTEDATVSGTTWTVHFDAADLEPLDGTIEVTAEHSSTPGGPAANTRTVLKDLVAPSAPTASPDAATFTTSVQVFLTGGVGGDTIRFTRGDGTQPDPTATTGQVYVGGILLSQTTTIKAVSVDTAGNVSPVMSRTFTRLVPAPTTPQNPSGPAVPTTPVPPGSGAAAAIPLAPEIGTPSSGKPGGADTATARWKAPVANGAVRDGYRVRALKIRPGRAAKIRPAVTVGPNVTKLKLTLPSGRYKFQVRATSAAGDSPWSERSVKVTAR